MALNPKILALVPGMLVCHPRSDEEREVLRDCRIRPFSQKEAVKVCQEQLYIFSDVDAPLHFARVQYLVETGEPLSERALMRTISLQAGACAVAQSWKSCYLWDKKVWESEPLLEQPVQFIDVDTYIERMNLDADVLRSYFERCGLSTLPKVQDILKNKALSNALLLLLDKNWPSHFGPMFEELDIAPNALHGKFIETVNGPRRASDAYLNSEINLSNGVAMIPMELTSMTFVQALGIQVGTLFFTLFYHYYLLNWLNFYLSRSA